MPVSTITELVAAVFGATALGFGLGAAFGLALGFAAGLRGAASAGARAENHSAHTIAEEAAREKNRIIKLL